MLYSPAKRDQLGRLQQRRQVYGHWLRRQPSSALRRLQWRVSLFDFRRINNYFNKRYGVNLVRFTHHNKCILCASNNENIFRIMYWSLYDNTILCSFIGHEDQITSLDVNPASSTFVSVSRDGVARVWDYERSGAWPNSKSATQLTLTTLDKFLPHFMLSLKQKNWCSKSTSSIPMTTSSLPFKFSPSTRCQKSRESVSPTTTSTSFWEVTKMSLSLLTRRTEENSPATILILRLLDRAAKLATLQIRNT